MSLKKPFAWFGSSAILAVALNACLPQPRALGESNTHVGRGELYKPGRATYDDYFAGVHALQVEVAAAPDEDQGVRSRLAQSLGLLPTAAPERILETLHQKAEELVKGGERFKIDAHRASLEGTKASEPGHTLALALDTCVRSEGALSDRMRKIPARAETLLSTAVTLEPRLPRDFAGLGRNEVQAEMSASKDVLHKMGDWSTAMADQRDKFVADLTSAVDVTAPTPTASVSASPPVTKKHGSSGASAGRKPAGGPSSSPAESESKPAPAKKPAVEPGADPPAKPVKKPAPSSDDFNP